MNDWLTIRMIESKNASIFIVTFAIENQPNPYPP